MSGNEQHDSLHYSGHWSCLTAEAHGEQPKCTELRASVLGETETLSANSHAERPHTSHSLHTAYHSPLLFAHISRQSVSAASVCCNHSHIM